MSSTSWRKSTSVTQKLTEHPYQFSFKQAVRVLERSNNYSDHIDSTALHAVGKFMPPQAECIRFSSNQSLSFPASEIASITHNTQQTQFKKQWSMDVNFIGLTGSHGVLPYHYTETVLKRLKLKDTSMKAFFDVFNHRTTSLFFQASSKYNAPLQYERNHLQKRKVKDDFTQMLMALVGLNGKHLTDRLYTKDESLLYYAGLLNSNVRSASGLKQILESHFSLPVEIKEFVGQWQDLIDDVRTRFPSSMALGQNNQLGKTVMLGKKGWFAQGKINIILGPLNKQQLAQFTPHTAHLKALDEIVRLYLGFEHDYSFTLRILKKDIPQSNLNSQSILGWTSWLSKKQQEIGTTDEIVDIPISKRK
ncbi:type VI secretion system baseplate subunit TssG [Psychromonas sp. psych-6C06]|uniref:type VI secretion system baseplate subunit TssG n=1 Tax=Psychromonas sp. psych-6C06 TaxID=2058089 RepID=UPI000C34ABD7|nr:type VI secretion system baseplate subunit TssG [Psychromonas sp. psych-6C06]PKF63483.1 type VI secretion system baseplate subunit TssG [Psychromonas sp. psych-6C06]